MANPALGPSRYGGLDAMRGLAALVVVVGHFGEETHTWQPSLFYVAVDLFFVLSGFVLARVYDTQFSEGMTAWKFLQRRVVRLMPLAVIGSALALGARLASGAAPGSIGVDLVSASAMALAIPTPPIVGASDILFPLNSAFWSLFLELWVANVLFAFGWRYVRGGRLAIVVAASALSLIACERVFHSMDVGWSWPTFAGGLARLMYSFFAGVFIARQRPGWLAIRVPQAVILIGLAGMLLAPIEGQAAQLVSLAYTLFGFPLLVALASARFERAGRLGALLGDVSYSVYVIHIPFIVLAQRLWGPAGLAWLQSGPVALFMTEGGFVVGIGAAAYLIDRAYDRPIRASLSRILAARGSAGVPVMPRARDPRPAGTGDA